MALLTADEFLDRCDARLSMQRLLDEGEDAELADLTDESSDAGRRLRTAIDDAEGMLVVAASVGARYSAADLETCAAGVTASAKAIKRVVADLALGMVLKRRGLPADDFAKLAPNYAEATAFLELVRRGDRVFPDVPGVPDAGLPETVSNIPRVGIDTPTLWSQQVRLFGNLDGQCQ